MVEMADRKQFLYIAVAYPGRLFYGSQIQNGLRTVEGELTDKAVKAGIVPAGSRIRLYSRTDRGVSALCNIFRLKAGLDGTTACARLNRILRYVQCTGYAVHSEPREVISKSYSYYLSTDRPAEEIKKIAGLFEGEHNFRNFVKGFVPFNARIDDIAVERIGSYAKITVKGRKFMWGMVRKIVWTIDHALSGHISSDEIRKMLSGGLLIHAGLADPSALVLEKIDLGLEFTPVKAPMADVKELIAANRLETLLLERISGMS